MKQALIVGVDYYKKGLLNNCVTDARNINHALASGWGNGANVQLAAANTESNAINKDTLVQQISTLFATDSETALFYFSGHGYIDNDGNGYILTSDCNCMSDGLAIAELLCITHDSKAKDKTIILNFCHGGCLTNVASDTYMLLYDNVTIINAAASSRLADVKARCKHLPASLLRMLM